jgi:hypothetical protein
MAIIERGKGRNRRTIEIVQSGAQLRMQEVEGGDTRLPGYRRFSNPDAARAGLVAEVKKHLADGMKAADDDARAIAAKAEAERPAKPSLPLRCDLGIYNEATGFVVTSRRMAGKTLEEGSAEWKKAVGRGDLLPLSLVQDDSFVIRVVAGEPLTEQEQAEWVSRIDWHLNIPDGLLCITGGAVFSNDDYDDSESYSEQFVGEVAIPKGRYRASLYSMLQGINGDAVMDHLAGSPRRTESIEDWFARTRPGQTMPDEEGEDGRELAGFLLHLEPVDAAPRKGLSKLPDDGWFTGFENARKPDLCPLGLEARDVRRRATTESGEWAYVRDAFPLLRAKWGSATPEAFPGGGTVPLDAASVSRAARLAWFASRRVNLELRVQPPAGGRIDLSGPWPEGVVAAEEDSLARILFSSDLEPAQILERIGQLGSRFAAMPPGASLDVCAAPVEFTAGVPEKAGFLWLRGILRDGRWTIARALPSVTAPQLESALSLAAEVESSARISVRDQAESDAILAWAARRGFASTLRENPPKAGPEAITFKKPGYEVQLVGIAVFALRFSSVWPIWDGWTVENEDGDGDDENDDGMFPTEPIKGALLHTTAKGRTFHQSMALLISQAVADAVKKQEPGLRRTGFRETGDVMCAEFDQIAFHGYLRNDKKTLAWFRVSYPDEATCEVLSLFPNGAILLTSASANIKQKQSQGVHVQEFFGAATSDLVTHHEKRLAELEPTLGTPREIETGPRSLAEALAVVLEKD